ncbi:MAG: hypothetical protein WCA20_00585 [Candidatus Sulfotelmatobacter sp.]
MTAISLWENKTDAEAYNTNTYPEVLKTMARFIEGTPKVQTSDVVTSTLHKLAVHATAANVISSLKPFCLRSKGRTSFSKVRV